MAYFIIIDVMLEGCQCNGGPRKPNVPWKILHRMWE